MPIASHATDALGETCCMLLPRACSAKQMLFSVPRQWSIWSRPGTHAPKKIGSPVAGVCWEPHSSFSRLQALRGQPRSSMGSTGATLWVSHSRWARFWGWLRFGHGGRGRDRCIGAVGRRRTSISVRNNLSLAAHVQRSLEVDDGNGELFRERRFDHGLLITFQLRDERHNDGTLSRLLFRGAE